MAPEPNATEEKRACIDRVATSNTFARAEQLSRLLVWLARRTLDNLPSPTEYEVACAALRRPANFDPQTDSLVRREMNRLRAKLREYYAGEGSGDAVRLRPAGPYRLTFEAGESRSAGKHQPEALCLLVLPPYAPAASAETAEVFYSEFLTQLEGIDGVELLSQTTARAYMRGVAGTRQMAEDTGADFVVEGTLRATDQGLVAALWLVDPETARARVLCRLTGSNPDELAATAAKTVRAGSLDQFEGSRPMRR